MPKYDVIVAGAGPAGSSTAFHLATAGARVLVLDRAEFPRDKPCGGGVTARAFHRAPVDVTPVVERTVNRVRFSFRLGEFFDCEYPDALVYMTQRHRLDAFLLENAVKAGAEFRGASHVRQVTLTRQGACVMANGDAYEGGVVVGADGANGVVARSAGLSPAGRPPVALEANFAFQGRDAERDWSDLLALELGSMSGGYGWSFPKADHLNVGCGGFNSEGGRLRKHLSNLQRHYGLGGVELQNLRGHHLPTRDEGAAIVGGRALLVGDAAGLVDPMSGEGIYAAFVSGELASAKVLRFLDGKEPDLWSYEGAVERELMADIDSARTLRDAYHYTPRPCYLMLRHSRRLRTLLCQLITGERTYSGFLRQLGPLQYFLRYWAERGRRARAAPAG